ncbi:hypothetical protein NL676_004135 [Syzygium grande]|nr:hypothetical protein NL676_004135 [Syzygium grande]
MMPITLLETWQARHPSVSMKRKVTDIAGGRNAGSPIAVDLSMIYGAENCSSLKGIDSLYPLHFYCNSNSARPHSQSSYCAAHLQMESARIAVVSQATFSKASITLDSVHCASGEPGGVLDEKNFVSG